MPVQHVQTESVSDASRLLDLDGLAVDRVESDAFGGRVVHVVTADRTASACPALTQLILDGSVSPDA